jgi:hypothetical protein
VSVFEFDIVGRPYPKGSLKCLGAAGGKRGARHILVEEVEGSKPWKLRMIAEVRKQAGILPVKSGNKVIGWVRSAGGVSTSWEPIDEAVAVAAVFRFWPEMSKNGGAVPSSQGTYPSSDHFGDLDKLCRNLGDALEQGGLIRNDRLIVSWNAAKVWCGSLEAPGVNVVVGAAWEA